MDRQTHRTSQATVETMIPSHLSVFSAFTGPYHRDSWGAERWQDPAPGSQSFSCLLGVGVVSELCPWRPSLWPL